MGTMHRSVFGIICALAITTGCGGSGPSTDTASRGGDSGGSNAGTTPRATTAKIPGKLKVMPETSPAEWQAYVQALEWSTMTAQTEKRGCQSAPAQHGDCNLEITAAEGAVLVGPDDYEDAGRVIARIRNLGRETEAVYGVEPGETVYLQIMRKSDKKLVGRVVTVDGKIRIGSSTKPEHGFKRCDHGSSDTLQYLSIARFRTCDEVRLDRQDTTKHNSPAWITCAQGCCVVDEGGP